MSVGGRDTLAREALRLLASIPEPPLFPARRELESSLGRRDFLIHVAIARGLQALGWLVDERGLGGGRELDGLTWTLKLDRLWELYVAAHVSSLARYTGGQLYLATRAKTVFPLISGAAPACGLSATSRPPSLCAAELRVVDVVQGALRRAR